MSKRQITRNNHYVPIWYQKSFLTGRRTTLFYLDRDPPRTELPNGRVIIAKQIHKYAPRNCFGQKDLYTTRFGNLLIDDIEKFLFGAIDTRGAPAVRAFANNDQRGIHDNFREFFEFLDAQKLRTPKGLDWIRRRYPDLTQLDLMLEMQHLRQMHCTMWYECVREIVSAEQSDVKFIITDHPVTVYNTAIRPPMAENASILDEPSIALNGSQTIFPLNANCLLVLTNLEFAQDPSGVDPCWQRQNARFAGQTITRTDTFIRERILSREDVVAINSLLKSQSLRFIAAYEEEWLFPEDSTSYSWEDLGRILLPPRDELWHFGGEIYIGFKDGTTQYQDEFGRTESHKHLRKKNPAKALEGNDPCGCGSGRKYKHCCQRLPKDEHPPWDVYSIRDRNQILFNATTDILGLNKNATWEDVRRNLSDDQVKRIHEFIEMLWPKGTNIAELLPRPDRRTFRAVYMGHIDPRTIAVSVISSLAYFDEIVVANPFPNPAYIAREYSPTKNPSQHKSQMLKNMSVLFTLMPFIDAGLVHMVPDPMDFNADFRRSLWATIEERTSGWKPRKEEMRQAKALAKDDFERDLLRLPDDSLRSMIRESQPDISADLLERTVQHMKEKLLNDPLALLQPVGGGKDDGELKMFRSMSLEYAIYLASLTGAGIYTDDPAMWRQLNEFAMPVEDSTPLFPKFAKEVNDSSLIIETNPDLNFELRRNGKLLRMRRVFRKLFAKTVARSNDSDSAIFDGELTRLFDKARSEAADEWENCDTNIGPSMCLKRKFEILAPVSGLRMNSVHRFLITFGRSNSMKSVPVALFLILNGIEPDV